MHTPVMVAECLEYLSVQPDGVYADITCGLGGHTGAIARRLAALGGTGFVIACDRDGESFHRPDVGSTVPFESCQYPDPAEQTARGAGEFAGRPEILWVVAAAGCQASVAVTLRPLLRGAKGLGERSNGRKRIDQVFR